MNKITISPIQRFEGTITVPGDKSISHRAVMLGALSDGETDITNFLPGADCLATIDCFRKLGVNIEVDQSSVRVHGVGLHSLKKPDETLYVANSGTTMRMLSGILSAQPFESKLDGDASIRKRPMARVAAALLPLGAKLSMENGCCPITITPSKLRGAACVTPVASAQLKSSILLAGLYADGETSITEPSLSRNHTELMLKAFGADIRCVGTTTTVKQCEKLTGRSVKVPSDISSAAFFMVAALLLPGSSVTIKNVGVNPTRTGIIDALCQMGADITLSNLQNDIEPTADITVRYSRLKGITVGGDIIPRMIDELPVLAIAALFAEGTTVIRDAREMKVKESNRAAVLAEELAKCGANVIETDDGLIVEGGVPLSGAEFDAHDDHRIAMCEAVLAKALPEVSTIEGYSCVDISYPAFFTHLESLSKNREG